MAGIGNLDKNLEVINTLGRDDIVFYDPKTPPFSLYGLLYEDGQYRRMPFSVASEVSGGVKELSAYTAGGRVAFRTDSDCVAISCRRPSLWRMPHMALVASAGFDLYVRENGALHFLGAFLPSNETEGYSSLLNFPMKGEHEILIHFPLYCPISALAIGLKEGASVSPWSGYKREKPIVFYGSSITQGACASTPGGDYIGRISRMFDSNYLNLGFSGNAKGEQAMMDYIASLDMSAFVYDYDHNAPNPEHLLRTHAAGYRTVREAHPDLPIIIMSRPNFDNRYVRDAMARRDVIAKTYEDGIAAGDRNLYFVDGAKEFATFVSDGCTVDGSHPNDVGFARMADAVARILRGVWKEENLL